MWPFKKKKPLNIEFETINNEIPIGTLMRWFLYDTDLAEEPNTIAKILGMTPVSEEGDEHEFNESEKRLDQIEYLLPFIDMVSEMTADVITSVQLDEIKKRDPDNVREMEREQDMMHMMYKMVAFSSLLGGLSSGVNLGLIQPGNVSNTSLEFKKLEGFDE
jgi:hypothetical protein